MIKRINLIAWDNGSGLSHSTKLLRQILEEAGFQVNISKILKPELYRHPLHQFVGRCYSKLLDLPLKVNQVVSHSLFRRPPYDLNLFLETVKPQWLPQARINCLIPNQEWFHEPWLPYLSRFDRILCKTKYAQSIFADLGCETELISFTSADRFDAAVNKDYNAFFHLAGSSPQKGTRTVIDLWCKHPEWPCLKVIQNPKRACPVVADNIQYIAAYMDGMAIQQEQNFHGIHLCPSEAEGFGHYIVEAMSSKAVVITTNAPPMNELITADRGLLADYYTTKPQKLGTNYYVDPVALERRIEEVLAMDEATKQGLGENARAWFLQNDTFFKHRIVEVINSLGQQQETLATGIQPSASRV